MDNTTNDKWTAVTIRNKKGYDQRIECRTPSSVAMTVANAKYWGDELISVEPCAPPTWFRGR